MRGVSHREKNQAVRGAANFWRGTEAIQNGTIRIESVYCPHCNLATPSWRGRCIHCPAPVPSPRSRPRVRDAAGNRKIA